MNEVARDIYILYDRKTPWKNRPSRPDFWMHQPGGLEEGAPFFDGDDLAEKINQFLREN